MTSADWLTSLESSFSIATTLADLLQRRHQHHDPSKVACQVVRFISYTGKTVENSDTVLYMYTEM
jgi:hypothetical protein